MSAGEPHEHGRTTCAYGGVNGVTFRVIAQSSAVSLLRQLFESLLHGSSPIQSFSVVLESGSTSSPIIAIDPLD
jgi:hypothetical protein